MDNWVGGQFKQSKQCPNKIKLQIQIPSADSIVTFVSDDEKHLHAHNRCIGSNCWSDTRPF